MMSLVETGTGIEHAALTEADYAVQPELDVARLLRPMLKQLDASPDARFVHPDVVGYTNRQIADQIRAAVRAGTADNHPVAGELLVGLRAME
jgi:hypothetical protein